MSILVTGCAGFIGSKISEQLAQHDQTIVGIDNLNNYYEPALKRHRLSKITSHNFKFIAGDITEADFVDRLFKSHKFNAVYHLAARPGVRASIEKPKLCFDTNLVGTLNLLECCRNYQPVRFLLASTSSLYAGHRPPFIESANTNRPISPYAASKLSAEALCFTYHHLYRIPTVITRYFTVYGPAGRPDMAIFRFIEAIRSEKRLQIYGDGHQTRDFTYIGDTVSGSILALQNTEQFAIINIGAGHEPVSVLDVIKQIESYIGKKAKLDFLPMHPADMAETHANADLAKMTLQWSPKTALTRGLESTIQWHLEHTELLDSIAKLQ